MINLKYGVVDTYKIKKGFIDSLCSVRRY